MKTYSESEILSYLISSGSIDLATVQVQIESMERQKYLDMHKYAIWQDTKGSYYTSFDDDTKAKGRRQIKRKNREDIESAIIEHYSNLAPTFDDVFHRWLDSKYEFGEVQQQTIDRYRVDYERLIQGTDISKKRIEEITEIELEEFIKKTIHDSKLTSKAWQNMRVLISGTLKYASKHGLTKIHSKVFFDELDISKKSFKRVTVNDSDEVFTPQEQTLIEEYLSRSIDDVVNLGILLTFETGLRVGELSTLKSSDIGEDYIEVQRTEVRYKTDGKGQRSAHVREWTKGRDGYRKVILTERAKEILSRIVSINPDTEYLFEKNGNRLKGTAFTSKLLRVCNKLEIEPRTMHKIRKTYATNLLNVGIDEKLITKQMGHTDISTTKHYYYFNNHTLDDAKEKLGKVRQVVISQEPSKIKGLRGF